jgi:hypothetical protein
MIINFRSGNLDIPVVIQSGYREGRRRPIKKVVG